MRHPPRHCPPQSPPTRLQNTPTPPGPPCPTFVLFIQLLPLGMGKNEHPAAAQLPAQLLTKLGQTQAGWGVLSILLPSEMQGLSVMTVTSSWPQCCLPGAHQLP